MKIDNERRVGASRAGSRIHYPYDAGWGLGERPPSLPLRNHVYPSLQKLPLGAVVLNLGCGDGNFERNSPPSEKRPYSFLSFDQDPVAIERLRGVINGGPDQAHVGDITALNLGEKRVAAAVSSRVLHALDADDQEAVAKIVAGVLEPGGVFHVTVLADIDWKAEEARRLGLLGSDTLIDFKDIMRFNEIGRQGSWNAFPFSPERFHQIADISGLVVVKEAEKFQEPTSFDHLRKDHPDVTYYYAALQKPEASPNGHNPKATVVYSVEKNGA